MLLFKKDFFNCYFILFNILILFGISSCSNKTKPLSKSVTKIWTCNAAFESPESVIYDAKNQCIYVSNGVGYGKNGKGFISKLSKSGEVISLHWINQLNRPTGMAIWQNQLFVADIDVLLVIDLEKEEIIKQYSILAKNPMLNDVAINSNGTIYVTASGNHSVYKLMGDSLTKIAQDTNLLQYANGIIATDSELIIAGWEIAKLSPETGEINLFSTENKLTDFDGLAMDEQQNLYCTQVGKGGKLWKVSPDGKTELIYQQGDYLADFDFVEIDGQATFLLATGNHESKEYGVLALGDFR